VCHVEQTETMSTRKLSTRKLETLPEDFSRRLSQALNKMRIGDYARARALLDPLKHLLPTEPVPFPEGPTVDDYYRLRLATLLAEVAEFEGHYKEAEAYLSSYAGIVVELKAMSDDDSSFHFDDPKDPARLALRQKIYYLWQRSVVLYRTDRVADSARLLRLAIDLGTRLNPPSQALLTQLHYGAGKLAYHQCRDDDAIQAYRQSLMSASKRLDNARKRRELTPTPDPNREKMASAIEAARYSMAKTLALGLGHCLREEGRLEEAHTQVVAGMALLNLGEDRELSHYAQLLLGSIRRSLAGESEESAELLERANQQIADCAEHFTKHEGEVGLRSRLELALIAMQQKHLPEARTVLESMLNEANIDKKWIAECSLALSRVARREGKHEEAVRFAERAVEAAKKLERIRRRAQVVYVLALYDAAVASDDVNQGLLDRALMEIRTTMARAAHSDVRTRANLLLTEARVLKIREQRTGALEAFQGYRAIAPFVEVGRIKELAKIVEKELAQFQRFECLADRQDSPVFDIKQNVAALRHYLKEKAKRTFPNKTVAAAQLGIYRQNIDTGTKSKRSR
jgi:tetratricopeptide (TPR) repeat protein